MIAKVQFRKVLNDANVTPWTDYKEIGIFEAQYYLDVVKKAKQAIIDDLSYMVVKATNEASTVVRQRLSLILNPSVRTENPFEPVGIFILKDEERNSNFNGWQFRFIAISLDRLTGENFGWPFNVGDKGMNIREIKNTNNEPMNHSQPESPWSVGLNE